MAFKKAAMKSATGNKTMKVMRGKAKAAASVMKAMKKLKKKKSVIAKGRLARFMVFFGRREKTSGGIRKDGIMKNRRNRYVSSKASAHGHKMYVNISRWTQSFKAARGQLKCQGFVAINGQTLLGKALYVRMRKIHDTPGGDGTAHKKEEEVKVEQTEQTPK